jgi:hypothetical protein
MTSPHLMLAGQQIIGIHGAIMHGQAEVLN